MDLLHDRSTNGSPISTRGGSPHRLQSRSYPPTRQHHYDAEIKLTDLMDEDEARWMSNAESSRSPTPSQVVPGASQSSRQKQPKQDYKNGYQSLEQQRAYYPYHKTDSVVRIGTPPPVLDSSGCSRNMTPPLPPLPHGMGSPKSHLRALSEPPTGLTALPHRKFSVITSSFAQRVFTTAKADLLYDYIERSRLPWHWRRYKHGALDVATLAKMQRHVLQQRLVEQVKAIGERGAWLDIGIADTIREYCQINRDLDYMQQHAHSGCQDDPFLITTARALEAKLLEEAGMARRNEHFDDKDLMRSRRLSRSSSASQALRRLSAMLLVALALIVPYLIALLAPTQLARVVTVCACILLFAVAATMLSVKRRSALWPAALTLAYAAALVIFIGVNPSRYNTT